MDMRVSQKVTQLKCKQMIKCSDHIAQGWLPRKQILISQIMSPSISCLDKAFRAETWTWFNICSTSKYKHVQWNQYMAVTLKTQLSDNNTKVACKYIQKLTKIIEKSPFFYNDLSKSAPTKAKQGEHSII